MSIGNACVQQSSQQLRVRKRRNDVTSANGDIGIVGLGHGGLALAAVLAEAGNTVRSTVNGGHNRNVVAPILAATGKKFDTAKCPERTLEGRGTSGIAGITANCRSRRFWCFRSCCCCTSRLTNSIVLASDIETAEIIKAGRRYVRDAYFRFANEVGSRRTRRT